MEHYTKEELRKVQLDDIVGNVLRWLEIGGELQRVELLLADPAVKYFWRFKENLAIRGGVLNSLRTSGVQCRLRTHRHTYKRCQFPPYNFKNQNHICRSFASLVLELLCYK